MPLSRSRITASALHIVDTEGLGALSMRRLGAELGVDASSIYYHVPNKSALYDLVVDAVMGDIDLNEAEGAQAAHAAAMAVVRAFHRTLLAHSNALPLLVSRSLTTPESLRPMEYLMGVLADAGVGRAHALTSVNVIAYYVYGASIVYAGHTPDSSYHDEPDESRLTALDPGEFPHISAALSDDARREFPEEFDIGAEALVTGLLTTATEPRK
jgi:AcrR family transcriptional regulator